MLILAKKLVYAVPCLGLVGFLMSTSITLPTLVGDQGSTTFNRQTSIKEYTVEILAADDTCTMHKDVEEILHFPSRASLVVKLKSKARCSYPFLWGRLSGPALSIINWTSDQGQESSDSTTLVGHYQVPVEGTYFVEVLVLFCNNFHDNVTSFENVCIDNPMNRTLVASQPITILKAEPGNVPAFWMSTNSSTPLTTRFQPLDCRGDHPLIDPKCSPHMDIKRFLPYHLQWLETPHTVPPRLGLSLNRHNKPRKLCIIGESHSRLLHENIVEYIRPYPNRLITEHFAAAYPSDINYKTIQQWNHSECSVLVIGIGQWPASWAPDHPYSFWEYETKMGQALDRLEKFQSDFDRIYMRSVNYNPLGDWIGSHCPPKDWRNPRVVSGYNVILRRLCKAREIQFLDTSFIIGPMWDSAPDYCHYNGFGVAEEHARYILSNVLGKHYTKRNYRQ